MAAKLTDAQIRHAKELLLKGIAPLRIARLYGCSAETIRRYKRGETRVDIVVEGEETLRPSLDLEELGKAVEPEQVDSLRDLESLASLQSLQTLLNPQRKALPWDTTPEPDLTATVAPLPDSNNGSGNLLD